VLWDTLAWNGSSDRVVYCNWQTHCVTLISDGLTSQVPHGQEISQQLLPP
jgi:hypothetical protein